MEVRFTTSGMYATERELERIADRGDHLQPVFEVIADRMMDHERTLFQTGGASVGRPWKALEPNTIKVKTKGGDMFPARPLSSSLRLMKSLTERGHPDQILEITGEWLRFGTRVPYAGLLDTGTSEMPQRRPIMFTVLDSKEYWDLVQSYIFRGDLNG